ncbi:dehydratase [Rhodobacterales bacterium HKCCSP123]|nr:dehydratase [Rhodobacterales bacterium HKCCSP123]
MTEGVFAAFQAASGDTRPIHYDRPYCAAQGHPDPLADGYRTLIRAAIGASPPAHQMGEALIGFIAQSSRFLAPVHCGDTLYPAFEIIRLEPGHMTGVLTVAITIHNQHGTRVCDGAQG